MDHVVGSKLNFFGRFNYAPSETAQLGATFSPFDNINTVRIKTLTLTSGATYIASPNFTPDLRFYYSKHDRTSVFQVYSLPVVQPPTATLLTLYFYTSADSVFICSSL